MVSMNDTLSYVLYKNPVSQVTLAGLGQLARATGIKPKSPEVRPITTNAVQNVIPLSRQIGANYNLIRIAAISGAAGVCLAAYGRHSLKDDNMKSFKEYQKIYESANQMHLIHSAALLVTPLTKRPIITGTLFITGIILFSGTCYYKAIQKSKGKDVDTIPAHLAPYGGVCFILGWLSMIF